MLKNKYVRDIGVGIISSIIFLLLVQPLLGLTWQVLKNSTFFLYESISNKIIRQSALGEVNMSDSLIFLAFLFGFVWYSVILFRKANFLIKRINHSEDEPSNYRKKILRGNLVKSKSHLLIRVKILKLFIILNLLIGLIFGIYLGGRLMISKGLIAEFNQKVSAVTPYLTDLEIKQLKSKWALMQNVKDFNTINSLIDASAKQAKIQLPESVYFF